MIYSGTEPITFGKEDMCSCPMLKAIASLLDNLYDLGDEHSPVHTRHPTK